MSTPFEVSNLDLKRRSPYSRIDWLETTSCPNESRQSCLLYLLSLSHCGTVGESVAKDEAAVFLPGFTDTGSKSGWAKTICVSVELQLSTLSGRGTDSTIISRTRGQIP